MQRHRRSLSRFSGNDFPVCTSSTDEDGVIDLASEPYPSQDFISHLTKKGYPCFNTTGKNEVGAQALAEPNHPRPRPYCAPNLPLYGRDAGKYFKLQHHIDMVFETSEPCIKVTLRYISQFTASSPSPNSCKEKINDCARFLGPSRSDIHSY